MKRLRRRVTDAKHTDSSTVPDISKTKTFDRNTFLECSNRMIRLVPTLNRRQDNGLDITTSQSSPTQVQGEMSVVGEDEPEEDPTTIDALKRLTTSQQHCLHKVESICETHPKQRTSSLSLIPDITQQHQSNVEMNALGIGAVVTLPRHAVAGTSVTTAGTSTALPLTFPIPTKENKPTSGRRVLWLKPLKSFVSFMSNIGDNIHITSYPTP